MAVPTTQFRVIPLDTTVAELDTPGERRASISGQTIVSTGGGNEADFGTVDISGGANTSDLLLLMWNVTANGGNTTIDTMKLWLATNGFDQAGSDIQWVAISGADETTPTNTENYIINATTASYTEAGMVETEPGSNNIWKPGPDDTVTSLDITTNGTTDDSPMWSMYANIASGETTGTYKGLDAGFELRFNFKYSYS